MFTGHHVLQRGRNQSHFGMLSRRGGIRANASVSAERALPKGCCGFAFANTEQSFLIPASALLSPCASTHPSSQITSRWNTIICTSLRDLILVDHHPPSVKVLARAVD